MTYKPKITKGKYFWQVDKDLPYQQPMGVPDARLRRLAQRWAGQQNQKIYEDLSCGEKDQADC